ncbi:MAG: hypothetical protein ACLUFZ_09075 [Oscillospiraceae bacterium]
MKCRNNLRSFLILTFLCVLLCLMPVRARASTTNLTTGVPDEVSLHVEITGEGTVTVGEVRLSATRTVSVKRHQPVTVSLKPKSGYQVSDVRLNGKSVLASLKDGKLVINALNLDGTLSVTFSKIPGSWNGSNPRTGDQQGTTAMIAALTAAASLMLLQLLRKKHSGFQSNR